MTYHQVLQFARTLRKNQTPSEEFFWKKVRNRNFLKLKFNRQHIIEHADIMGKKSYFIPDFYCHEKQLIIEIDGSIHELQKEYDQIREDILIAMNYHIIRFKNEEVLNDWETVDKKLKEFIDGIG